ncbi:MAG: hypothetical protein AAGI23_14780 [Bacteroidota bacterium]
MQLLIQVLRFYIGVRFIIISENTIVMNLETERKAFIGEMAARVLTMEAEDFLRLREAFKLDRKGREESNQASWFDTNASIIREAIQLSELDAKKERFINHQDVMQRARKVIRK